MKELLKLSLMTVLALSFVACDDDDDKKDNGDVDANACATANDLKCSADGKSLMICKDSKWSVKEACASGCDNKACKTSGDVPGGASEPCTTAGDLKCSSSGATLMICKDGTWNLKESCANGCADKACKAAEKPATRTEKEGDACEEGTFSEFCRDGEAYYCEDDEVVTMGCAGQASKGLSCVTIKDYYKAGIDYVDCLSADDKCSTLNETSKYCLDGDYDSMVYNTKCTEATNGEKYNILYEPYAMCYNYCSDEDPEACDEEGENILVECEDGFTETCNGNAASYCEDGYKFTETCKEGSSCAVIDNYYQDGSGYATCMPDETICEKVGDTKTVCEVDDSWGDDYAYSYELSLECVKLSNGKNYWLAVSDEKYCEDQCKDESKCEAYYEE